MTMDTKTSELAESTNGTGDICYHLYSCQDVDEKQMSKLHNWPQKPRKKYTKIKPVLDRRQLQADSCKQRYPHLHRETVLKV